MDQCDRMLCVRVKKGDGCFPMGVCVFGEERGPVCTCVCVAHGYIKIAEATRGMRGWVWGDRI